MKYCLINCYSDNNRGDLAIILSTIKLLKDFDKGAEIKGISTYNYSDPSFNSEHNILREHIDIFPALFGVVNVGGSHFILWKFLRFLLDTTRLLLTLILPKSFFWPIASKLYSKEERKSIKVLCNSDYVISKGGSFICSEKDLRSQVALIRVLYIFFLSFKLGKRPFILCQSIGPYYGWLTRLLTNRMLSKCSAVILRENVCIEQYPYIKLPVAVDVATDIAFFADSINCDSDIIPTGVRLNVGVTIKQVPTNKQEKYIAMFVEVIEKLIITNNANIFIFPHVTIERDIDTSFEVYRRLSDRVKPHVTVFSEQYHAMTLKSLYGKMNIFVGTRLHSTIFALSENVPSICISYHGTKSLGVFKTLGLERYVIDDYEADLLNEKIDLLLSELNVIKGQLECNLSKCKISMLGILIKHFKIIDN